MSDERGCTKFFVHFTGYILKEAIQKNILAIQIQIRLLESNLNSGNAKLAKDLQQLVEFFPSINYEKITEYEAFHKGIIGILKDQIDDEKKEYLEKEKELQRILEEVEIEISHIADLTSLSEAVLKDYSGKKSKIDQLRAANDAYLKKDELVKQAKEKKIQYSEEFSNVADSLAYQINVEMDKFCKEIDLEKNPPLLKFKNENAYEFKTPDDSGTGNNYKSIILFDLACLIQSDLPLLIHDSDMFANIELKTIEKIMKLYAMQKKQIFIAIDKLGHLDE